jgi:hypothetical protein
MSLAAPETGGTSVRGAGQDEHIGVMSLPRGRWRTCPPKGLSPQSGRLGTPRIRRVALSAQDPGHIVLWWRQGWTCPSERPKPYAHVLSWRLGMDMSHGGPETVGTCARDAGRGWTYWCYVHPTVSMEDTSLKARSPQSGAWHEPEFDVPLVRPEAVGTCALVVARGGHVPRRARSRGHMCRRRRSRMDILVLCPFHGLRGGHVPRGGRDRVGQGWTCPSEGRAARP